MTWEVFGPHSKQWLSGGKALVPSSELKVEPNDFVLCMCMFVPSQNTIFT